MKKAIKYILYFVLAIVVLITGREIYSYLTDSTNTNQVIFTVGRVSFELEGELTNEPYLVPSENMIKKTFTLKNLSTVSSEIRMSITILINGRLATEEEVMHTIDIDVWTYNEIDQYYYLNEKVLPSTNTLIILDYMALDGKVVKNEYSHLKVEIHFIFHAKQEAYATWEALGDQSFTLGD